MKLINHFNRGKGKPLRNIPIRRIFY